MGAEVHFLNFDQVPCPSCTGGLSGKKPHGSRETRFSLAPPTGWLHLSWWGFCSLHLASWIELPNPSSYRFLLHPIATLASPALINNILPSHCPALWMSSINPIVCARSSRLLEGLLDCSLTSPKLMSVQGLFLVGLGREATHRVPIKQNLFVMTVVIAPSFLWESGRTMAETETVPRGVHCREFKTLTSVWWGLYIHGSLQALLTYTSDYRFVVMSQEFRSRPAPHPFLEGEPSPIQIQVLREKCLDL